MGAFPWLHDSPALPGLSLEKLYVAVTFLLRRNERCVAELEGAEPPRGAFADDGDEREQQDAWLNAVSFQSMAGTIAMSKTCNFEKAPDYDTSKADNMHLLQAYKLVLRHNRERIGNGKSCRYGPPVVPISELPSSMSQTTEGHLQYDQFKSFLKILLASELYRYGWGPETLTVDLEKLENITTSVLGAFMESSPGQDGITWSAFMSTMAKTTVCHKANKFAWSHANCT